MGTVHLLLSLSPISPKQKEKKKVRTQKKEPSFLLSFSLSNLTTNVHEMNVCYVRLIVVYQSYKDCDIYSICVCMYLCKCDGLTTEYLKGNKTFRWRWRREGLEQRESGQNYYLCSLPTYTLFLAAFYFCAIFLTRQSFTLKNM